MPFYKHTPHAHRQTHAHTHKKDTTIQSESYHRCSLRPMLQCSHTSRPSIHSLHKHFDTHTRIDTYRHTFIRFLSVLPLQRTKHQQTTTQTTDTNTNTDNRQLSCSGACALFGHGRRYLGFPHPNKRRRGIIQNIPKTRSHKRQVFFDLSFV